MSTLSDFTQQQLLVLKLNLLPIFYDKSLGDDEKAAEITDIYNPKAETVQGWLEKEKDYLKVLLKEPKPVQGADYVDDDPVAVTEKQSKNDKPNSEEDIVKEINAKRRNKNRRRIRYMFAQGQHKSGEKDPVKLVEFLHLVRMELGRSELEIPVLEALKHQIEFVEETIRIAEANLKGVVDFQRARADVAAIPENLIPLQVQQKKRLNIDQSHKYLNDCTAQISQFLDDLKTELIWWKFTQEVVLASVPETNSGLHLLQTDVSKMKRAKSLSPSTIRTMENLTKIWIKFIDPTLGLTLRDGTNISGPYSRYVAVGLLFLGIEGVTIDQIVDRARRSFRPLAVRNRRPRVL